MPDARRDLVRMHASCFNGRDLDNIAWAAQPDAPCFCDGEWVGEGPVAMREALEREFTQDANLVGRIARLHDEPVILEVGGHEGHWEPRGAVRLRSDRDGRIREMRIDHAPRIVGSVVPDHETPSVRSGVSRLA